VNVDTVASIVAHLLSIGAHFHRARGLAPDATLYITKQGRGTHLKSEKGNDRLSEIISNGCGIKGHIKAKCRSNHMWASYKKSKSYANLATSTSFAQYGSFLCSFRLSDTVSDSASRSVIMVNVASSSRSEHPWIGTTGATNPVTRNRPLFVTFPSMGKGGHQVKTANIRFVAAEGPGVIMFYVNRPKAKHAKIVRQHVFYLATCSKNTLLRNTQ
jgi:hypothetical protein